MLVKQQQQRDWKAGVLEATMSREPTMRALRCLTRFLSQTLCPRGTRRPVWPARPVCRLGGRRRFRSGQMRHAFRHASCCSRRRCCRIGVRSIRRARRPGRFRSGRRGICFVQGLERGRWTGVFRGWESTTRMRQLIQSRQRHRHTCWAADGSSAGRGSRWWGVEGRTRRPVTVAPVHRHSRNQVRPLPPTTLDGRSRLCHQIVACCHNNKTKQTNHVSLPIPKKIKQIQSRQQTQTQKIVPVIVRIDVHHRDTSC